MWEICKYKFSIPQLCDYLYINKDPHSLSRSTYHDCIMTFILTRTLTPFSHSTYHDSIMTCILPRTPTPLSRSTYHDCIMTCILPRTWAAVSRFCGSRTNMSLMRWVVSPDTRPSLKYINIGAYRNISTYNNIHIIKFFPRCLPTKGGCHLCSEATYRIQKVKFCLLW